MYEDIYTGISGVDPSVMGDLSQFDMFRVDDEYFTIINAGGTVSTNDPRFKESESSSVPSSSVMSMASIIKSSSTWKQAYRILSSDSRGKPYLEQLLTIPESYALPQTDLWDDLGDLFGVNTSFDDLIVDYYNKAMEDIRQVLQDFYNFINTLPTTHTQQFADAGINSAVTGEGIEGSSMPDTSIATSATPQVSQTDNKSLSQGVTSFVEFISAMSGIATAGFSSASLMGMLDIAERDQLNKQELHDLLMSQQGVTTSRPERILTPQNTQVVGDLAKVASTNARVASGSIDDSYSVQIGDDTTKQSSFEILSGEDVLRAISKQQLIEKLSNAHINSIMAQIKQTRSSILAQLETSNQEAQLSAGIAQGEFNTDYYNARNGFTEGQSQTSIQEHLKSIQQAESYLRSFAQWRAEYQYDIMSDWGNQIAQKPHLAPYFYKALFDFDMSDTFYHQSRLTMGGKYGLEFMNSAGAFLAQLVGMKKPPKAPIKTGQSSTTAGPKGVTTTETTYTY